jgi:hypothetical protein
VTLKAELTGGAFDLAILSECLPLTNGSGVGSDDGTYYLSDPSLDRFGDHPGDLHRQATDLLNIWNGIARSLHSIYQPVTLSGGYTDETGAGHVVVAGVTAVARAHVLAVGQVLIDGVPVPSPQPEGSRRASMINAKPLVAEVFRLIGQPDPPDWVDLYKVFEKIEDDVGAIAGPLSAMGVNPCRP